MIRNLGIIIFVMSYQVHAKLSFKMDHFSRKSDLTDLQAQRTFVRIQEDKIVDSELSLALDTTAIYSFVNSDQFIARDEERDLGININKFLVQYKMGFDPIELNLSVGVQPTNSSSAASRNISGPGIKANISYSDRVSFKTGVYTIPSFRQFFINKSSDGANAQLWSNELLLNLESDDKSLWKFSLGYDFFYDLGQDIAFQSGLRGNSISGTQFDAEFLFDYSVVSTMLSYQKQFGKWTISPFLQYSKNVSAYDDEAFYRSFGSLFKDEKISVKIAKTDIQKNALLSIYTPEFIDSSDVDGYEISFSSHFRQSFIFNSRIANFKSLTSDNEQKSITMGLTYFHE